MMKSSTLRFLWSNLAALFLVFSTPCFAEGDLAFLRDTWRPSPEAAIAIAGDRAITELDVYLWQLTVSADPLIVKNWREAIATNQVGQLREIEKAVRQIIEYRALSELPEARQGLDAVTLEKGTRLYAAPAAKFVMTDELIEPATEISPLDIAHFYRMNESEFRRPAEVDVRRLRVSFPEPLTEAGRQEALRRARELRQMAVSRGGLLPVLREHPEYQIDSSIEGSRTIAASGGDVDTRVRDRVFELSTSEISAPIETPNGILLVEVLERRAGSALPIASVQREIRETLRARFLPQQFQYQLADARAEAHPINRIERFPYMDDEAEVLRVRRFFLTKGEYSDLFPERVVLEGRVPGGLYPHGEEIIAGEVVTQVLEEMLYDQKPAYRAANEMAEDLVLAVHALRHRRAAVQPTAEDVDAYLAQYQSELLPEIQATLWRIDVEPRDEDSLPAATLRNLTPQMLAYLGEQVAVAEQQLRERAAITGDSILSTPGVVLRRLTQPEDSRLRLRYRKLETMDAFVLRRDFGLSSASLRSGTFTPPRAQSNGTVSAYYVEGVSQPAALTSEELRERARLEHILRTAREPGLEAVRQLERSGRLKWNIPVSGESPKS